MAKTGVVPAKSAGLDGVEKLILASAAIELITGIVVIVAPAFVGSILFGLDFSAPGRDVMRLAGIALISLAIACGPRTRRAAGGAAAIRGLLVYNGAAAVYFCYWRAAYHAAGPLLWPAVAVHFIFAALFLRAALSHGGKLDLDV